MAKLTKLQTKSLASGIRRPRYKAREIRTVKNYFNNHEIWRICQNCGEETDVRKSPNCDNCGAKVDLSVRR